MKRVLKIQAVFLLLLVTCCQAVTNKVPADYPTFQSAIDDCNDGDIVLVAPGLYTGDGNRDIDFKGKAITVKSEEGPESCIIDCNGTKENPHRGFNFQSREDANSVLEGFTISNGLVDKGAAIFIKSSSPIIQKCYFIYNTALQGGGAIYAQENNREPGPSVLACRISSNRAFYGGAIYCFRSDAKISNSILNDNVSSDSGGAVFCSQSAPSFTNCTIVRNHANKSGGAFFGTGAAWSNRAVTFENCIIWDNSASEGDVIFLGGCDHHAGCPLVKITYCCLPLEINAFVPNTSHYWNVDYMKSVFSLEPRFENPDSGDFHLRGDSPCVDAGNNDHAQVLPSTDISGISRIIDGDCDGIANIDLGAHETQVLDRPTLRPSAWICEFVAYEDNLIPEPQRITINKLGTGMISWQVTSDAPWLTVSPDNDSIANAASAVTLRVDASGLSSGTYEEDIVFYDSNAPESRTYISVILNLAETFVIPDQFATIQAAIDSAAISGTRIILRDNTYKGTGNRDITFKGKAISLFSENGPENCIIDCEDSESQPHRAFMFDQFENHRTIIEGITVTGAYFPLHRAIDCVCGSPIIRKCIIMDSPSGSGGISCGPGTRPLIEDCFIEGVIYCYKAVPDINRCDVTGRIECESGHLSVSHSSVTGDIRTVHLDDSDCTITASTITGSIYLYKCGHVNLNDCTIRQGSNLGGNIIGDAKHINIQGCLICDGRSAGISCTAEQVDINNCTIRSNKTTGIRLSGIQYPFLGEEKECNVSIRNCMITKNGNQLRGGGINCSSCDVTIEDCQIVANNGSGVFLYAPNKSTISRSVICANRTDLRGAGVRCSGSQTIITNCTIASNFSMYEGGALHGYAAGAPSHFKLLNCILWENGPRPLVLWDDSSADANFCDIQKGWPGLGNIDVDPLFAQAGHWDPNGTSENLDDDFWVDGDYHLQSQAGRWESKSQSWVQDDVTSPCIDAGDPNSPIGQEPFPNGDIINIGAYGGTIEASKSFIRDPVSRRK